MLLRKSEEILRVVRSNLNRAFTVQSKNHNLRHLAGAARCSKWHSHLGDRVFKRRKPLSSVTQGFATWSIPKYARPYTIVKVQLLAVYDLADFEGRRIPRIHIKDLQPVAEPNSYSLSIYHDPSPIQTPFVPQ